MTHWINQPRDEEGQWTDGGASSRSARARRTHKPSTAAKQERARDEEVRLAQGIGGELPEDRQYPVDVLKGRHGVEVKTVMDNNNNKITMHPSSRRRKEAFARENKVRLHTVAIDVRGGTRRYYYREGVGAFRLSAMKPVTVDDLRRKLN